MVYDTAKLLANELKNSVEYREFTVVKARAMENKTTRALIDEYSKLQIHAQAAMIAGDKDSDALKKLQKVGELLQFDADASAYLMAEFRLKRMVGDVYKILADAVDIDLSPLES